MKSFSEILNSVIRSANIQQRHLQPTECQSSRGQRCALCYAVSLEYSTEQQLKNKALQEFWKSLRLGVPLEPLVASPMGRNYRTISKRKVFTFGNGAKLGLISPDEGGTLKPLAVLRCAIEPAEHAAIYTQIQSSLEKPYASKLAKELTYAIVKGNYTEQTVILNVKDISPDVIRSANTLSKSLTNRVPSVIGVFLYEDDSSPQYYMGSRNQDRQPKFKKLFGKSEIFHEIRGKKFLFSPLSFSQVNLSILDHFIQSVHSLLKPNPNAMLFDLYCGYGMFGLCLAGGVRGVLGVELSGASIDSALSNAKRQHTANTKFVRSDINSETLERLLQNATEEDVVILDPPRKGTASGVIECVAAKRPQRVVHLFCEIDLLLPELKRWTKSGYEIKRSLPFDMFPGTATVETAVLLERK